MQTGLESTVSANTCGSRGLECWSDSSDELFTLQGQSNALLLFVDGLGKRIYICRGYGQAAKNERDQAQQAVSSQAFAPRDAVLFEKGSRPRGIGRLNLS